MNFARAAEELRLEEVARLSASIVPTLESLRALSGQQLRGRVALMLEQFGHEVLTPETVLSVLAPAWASFRCGPAPVHAARMMSSAI